MGISRGIPELMFNFPDYTSKQCPDKYYLFSVLRAVRRDQLKELIQEARKERLVYEEPDINEFIEITEEMKRKLMKSLLKRVGIRY